MSDSIRLLEELSEDIQSRLGALTYEELSELMDRRQIIVDQIEQKASESPLTESEKQCIRAVIGRDMTIQVRINFLRNEAAHWLKQRNQAKAQRRTYETAYTPDAYLMDSRK
ncbi:MULTISPECIES: hypothetical protein [unclassified Paenibacillus]|uniref:hypothetical protein n=1 Tax=unclassified Paenibacillus TaxID=185978 RepID=UPI0007BFA928|nr:MULTISPECIES: hypothetical protein [unclassified Paenibacillus]SDK87005.1 hypothetical protein SAMN05428961_10350 [Paenibacillus sp. OK060]